MGKLGIKVKYAVIMAMGGTSAWFSFASAESAIERAHTPAGAVSRLSDPVSIVMAVDRQPAGKIHQISENERVAARQALRIEPLLPAALWLLQRQDPEKFDDDRSLLLLTDRVSRRDLPTEFALIQSYAAAGNAKNLLEHIDHASSTIAAGGEPLMEQVALGLENPEISALLLSYAGRPWVDQVLASAFAKGPKPDAAANYLIAARIAPGRVFRAKLPNLLKRLVKEGGIQKAVELAKAMGWKGSLDETGFPISRSSADQNFAPLNWTITNSVEVNTVFSALGGFLVNVQPGNSGIMVTKYTSLLPGYYELNLVFRNNNYYGNIVRIRQFCQKADRLDIMHEHDIKLGDRNVKSVFTFEVRDSCPVQFWMVDVSAFDSHIENSFDLVSLRLTPVAR